MTRREPSLDFDPDDQAYGVEPEAEQDIWPDDGGYLDDVAEPVIDDPLAFADEHMARLGLTLDFGPGDLAFNRSGNLSPAQIMRLENDLRWFYWPMIAALVGFALMLASIGLFSGTLSLLVPALVVLGLAVIPALLLNRERQRLPDRLVHHTTARMGGFSLTVRRWGLNDDSKLPVDGGRPIFAPKHIYKVLRSNQTYLVYYVPVRTWSGYRLLSMEPREGAWEKHKRKAKRMER